MLNLKKNLFFLLLVTVTSQVGAASDFIFTLTQEEIDLLPPAFVKQSEKNLRRVKDPENHRNEIIWGDMNFEKLSYDSSEKYCKSLGARLPTLDEFLALRRA